MNRLLPLIKAREILSMKVKIPAAKIDHIRKEMKRQIDCNCIR